jgi:methionine sulfoxide reductase heme-binding subunit
MKKLNFTPLQIAVHIGAWVPLAWLVWAYVTHHLTINPIQDATQRTGRYALALLVLCLACTPLNTVLGWRGILRVKRALGMYSFLYALIHVLILSGLDYSFNFIYLYSDFRSKVYIWAGLAAFLILLALAVTAFRWAMKLLGKNWKRLHRLVYAAGVLVVLHYAWAKKGDLFRLQGDIRQPLLYGLLVILLLGLRIPPVARRVKRLRIYLVRRFSRYGFGSKLTRFRLAHARFRLAHARRTNRAESSAPQSP